MRVHSDRQRSTLATGFHRGHRRAEAYISLFDRTELVHLMPARRVHCLRVSKAAHTPTALPWSESAQVDSYRLHHDPHKVH